MERTCNTIISRNDKELLRVSAHPDAQCSHQAQGPAGEGCARPQTPMYLQNYFSACGMGPNNTEVRFGEIYWFGTDSHKNPFTSMSSILCFLEGTPK